MAGRCGLLRLLFRSSDGIRAPMVLHSRAGHFSARVRAERAARTPEEIRADRRRRYTRTLLRERPNAPPVTEAVQTLFDQMTDTLKKRNAFPKSQLFQLFYASQNVSDVNLSLKLLQHLHKFRAAKLKVFHNFKDDVSQIVASAFVRCEQPYYALHIFRKFNPFGLCCDLKAYHQLLEYATEKLYTRLSFRILDHMRRNSVRPTADTAHIIIKQCLKQKRAPAVLTLAREFRLNDLQLHPKTYDMCVVSAANSGRVRDLYDIQKDREYYNIPHSPSSIFSLAKAHLLKHKPEEAAKLVVAECKDVELMRTYIRSMVRLWPVQLVMAHTGSKISAKHSMNTLKPILGEMLQCLRKLGVNIEIDLEEHFGAAKGEGDKYEYCFGDKREPVAAS